MNETRSRSLGGSSPSWDLKPNMEPLIPFFGVSFLAILFGTQLLAQFAKRWAFAEPKYKPIPGPTQFPLIGRIHDLPRTYAWVKFKEWSDKHGPIYLTSMLGTKLLVLSDEKIVDDLLVKRSKIYSDRPSMRSVVDSKSTHGTMEYLPLMGKNRKKGSSTSL